MASNEDKSKATSLFESRFMSIALMLCLLIMCAIFIVVINSIFGTTAALEVLMYIGIGIGGGMVYVISILLIFSRRKGGMGRNIILYSAAIILILSLIISLIVKFAIGDDLGNWAFIDASSVGLGVTTGLALTYLILAMFRSKLVFREEKEEEIKTKVDIGGNFGEINEKE
jgi:MFS family permease